MPFFNRYYTFQLGEIHDVLVELYKIELIRQIQLERKKAPLRTV